MSYDSSRLLNPKGSGTWTLAQLLASSPGNPPPPGTSAYVLDTPNISGVYVWNGTAWVPQSTPTTVSSAIQIASTIPSAQLLASRNYTPNTATAGFMPLVSNDPTVLVDIGLSALGAANKWTSLPSGWAFTAGTAATVDDVVGFTPDTANNNNGRVQITNLSTASAIKNFSVYTRIDKRAITMDQSVSTTSNWYDGIGNPKGASPGSYTPCVWQIYDSVAARGLNLVVFGSTFNLWDTASGVNAYFYAEPLLNPPLAIASPNTNPNYWDVVVTVNGAILDMWVDGVHLGTVTNTNGAYSAGTIYYFSLGCGVNGANGNAGALGPYPIQRLQIASVPVYPKVLSALVGFVGDSYVVQSGGCSGAATETSNIPAFNSMQYLTNINNPFVSGGNRGQGQWLALLNSYAMKQLGANFSAYVGAVSGKSTYFTGGYSAPLVTYPSQTQTWDAVNANQPSILVIWDSVNNGGYSPNTTGAGVTPVADMSAHFNYLANGNPNLKYIICVEMVSLEFFGANLVSALTPAQWRSVSAAWRAQMRAAFNAGSAGPGNGSSTAGARGVPIIYVPTYEQWAASSDNILLHWGTNPSNTCTSTVALGNASTANPDIHPDPHGHIRIADIIWPTLKQCLLGLPLTDSGTAYTIGINQGGTGTAPVPNCVQGLTQVLTMNGNVTVGIPINPPQPGAQLQLTFVQDATAGRTLAFNAIFRNAPTIAGGAATAGQRATVVFRYDGVGWQYIGGSTAFA